MRGRWATGAGLFVVGVALGGFSVFLATQGVERAGWWAGIGSFFTGAAALVVAVWAVLVSTRPGDDTRPGGVRGPAVRPGRRIPPVPPPAAGQSIQVQDESRPNITQYGDIYPDNGDR